MKKFFLMLLFSTIMTLSWSCSFAKQAKVDFHMTSTNGCDLHIVGTVDYTIIPPAITGFHGTVTTGPPCVAQTLTFKRLIPEGGGTPTDLDVEFDSNDICAVSSIVWTGDTEITTFLNSPFAVSTLINEIHIQAECE